MAPRKTTTRKPATGTRKSTAAKAATPATRKTSTPRKTVKIQPKVAETMTETMTETMAAETPVVAPEAEMAPVEESLSPQLRKRGLITAVTERAGIKRRDAKASVEAALEVLGEAIADGRGLNLPGLGKLKVVRTKKMANAHIYVTRIRQPDGASDDDGSPEPGDGGKDPLAEAAE